MIIRTVVVDDEPLARERVVGLLALEPDVEVVGQCCDGREAVDAIERLKPDLVFLDIQMPEFGGFDVVEAIGVHQMPVVIFVTAFDEHALHAFEVRAIDYLLKPFGRARFSESLERARRAIRAEDTGDIRRRIDALVSDLKSSASRADRLVIKADGRVIFLGTDEIAFVEAAGNYVRVHAGPAVYLIRETMNSIESRLNPDKFFRIHRSRIVNIDSVKELQPYFNGDHVVLLRDGTRLILSRGYREKLQQRLGQAF